MNNTSTTPPAEPRRRRANSSLLAQGEPAVWLTGGALTVALAMIVGLLIYIIYQGGSTFWPRPVLEVKTYAGKVLLGELTGEDNYRPDPSVFASMPSTIVERARTQVEEAKGWSVRRKLRTGNKEDTGYSFKEVSDFEVSEESVPPWALVIERRDNNGNSYGIPDAFRIDGTDVAADPEEIWEKYQQYHPEVQVRFEERLTLQRRDLAQLNDRENEARLALRKAELKHGIESKQYAEALEELRQVRESVAREKDSVETKMRDLSRENDRYKLLIKTSDGGTKIISLADIVRAYPPNQLSRGEKFGVYFSRWKEFLSDVPRNANQEGGVMPAIFGTVAMTLIMSLLVVPFGVLAALYLREYAKGGTVVSAVRIAVNNLAGVPSIVFGVFGLGFFCYIIGASVDQWFYAPSLPSPTFGKGGLFWASLTLALLTLPVVIVATEEALAAVPNSMREGSYSCGASKWQTIRRIVLPRAMPGIMTGMILAMARGAGEVAPLMLVGAVKFAPELPVDFSDWGGSVGPIPTGPFHPERSFMHLGFHIYDVGFQSRDPEAAKPMVFTTTLLLIALIAFLNITAIWLRSRLRRRYRASQF